jgi:hypothetical protein
VVHLLGHGPSNHTFGRKNVALAERVRGSIESIVTARPRWPATARAFGQLGAARTQAESSDQMCSAAIDTRSPVVLGCRHTCYFERMTVPTVASPHPST